MKQFIAVLMIMLLLCGCGAEETMETVADELVVPVMAQPKQIRAELPGEAAMPAVEGSSGRIYVCEDYEIVIQTYPSGDLDATVQELSGYSRQDLTVLETDQGGVDRYDFVWASAGEGGDQLGRAVILDDGNYHYVVTVLGSEDSAGEMTDVWQDMLDSFDIF